jgi:hypothetical protein
MKNVPAGAAVEAGMDCDEGGDTAMFAYDFVGFVGALNSDRGSICATEKSLLAKRR